MHHTTASYLTRKIMQERGPLNMSGKQVLLIDDDAAFCQMVTEILAPTICHVTATTDYREGLRMAMMDRPDLILLDIHMPEVSGLELIKQLRNMQATRNIPVMMVTGDDRSESVQLAKQYNAVGYILKPFKPLYLLERMGQLMGVELLSSIQQATLHPKDAKPSETGKKHYSVKTKTLLVIDDEPLIFQLISDILEDSIVNVRCATNAREGLRIAMTSPVDVILLDAHMPEIDGIEAAEQLKHMQSTKDTPIVMMSGHLPETAAKQAQQVGAVDFLAKPFNPGQLVACLQQILNKEIFWA
ncbi:MAG: response regulator [Candidatus Sericytochromatia bacterium]|nr:response regulator [Candidatus Sericytochromatia bacterium]